jgi:hypothetical protein
VLTLLLLTLIAANDPPEEAPLPPGVVPLEEPGRYRSSRTYDETLDFYERQLRRVGGIRWHNVVSLPGIKAKNIECLRKSSHWEGINVYDNAGEVRIYVIPREKPPAQPKAAPAPKTKEPAKPKEAPKPKPAKTP